MILTETDYYEGPFYHVILNSEAFRRSGTNVMDAIDEIEKELDSKGINHIISIDDQLVITRIDHE